MSHLKSTKGPNALQRHVSALANLLLAMTVPYLLTVLGWSIYIESVRYYNTLVILLLSMDLAQSSRPPSESRVNRNTKEEHLNTVYLPYEKTIQAVPYYARKKRELKSKNYALQHQDQNDRLSSKLSGDLNNSVQFKTRKNLKNMITEISVEPVINDNKFTNFDPELYPLQQSEKVKVVEEKYFPLQNYYNYIWAVKSSQEIFRIAQQTEKKAQEALFSFVGDLLDGDYDQSHKRGPLVKQTMKIKGVYQSRFNPYQSNVDKMSASRERQSKPLAPIHVEYKQQYPKKSPFSIKQGQRVNILRGQSRKQQPFASRF